MFVNHLMRFCLVGSFLLGSIALAQTDETDLFAPEPFDPMLVDWLPLTPGVSYRVIKPSDGQPIAKVGDYVTISYTAYVKGSAEPFGTSPAKKKFTFILGKSSVLDGIQHGVNGMQVGEYRQLLIAPEKGFGDKDKDNVPAGSTLIIDVHLIDIFLPVATQILEPGTGVRKAQAGDIITINYVGKLEDGTIFDTNDSDTQPLVFGISAGTVITGLSKGVIGMVVGEKRQLNIPAQLAYGEKETPEIPANSKLIYEIKCLAIEDGCIIKTFKEGDGPALNEGQVGEVAIRLEGLNGKVLYDTKYSKPIKIRINRSIQPAGLYDIALGMQEGEIRHATIKSKMSFKPGKPAGEMPMNVVIELISIVEDQ